MDLNNKTFTTYFVYMYNMEYEYEACVACKKKFEIDFCRLKIQFVEHDFSNLIFQNSSTDQQGARQA